MTKIDLECSMTNRIPILLAATLLAVGLLGAPAHAQLSRTFVSQAGGNDANNCDRPTPCRTFQAAHDRTNTDGEIIVLEAGGYGALTITKSISVVNDSTGEASILVSGGATGITINAGAASYINLRGITVQGIGFGGGTGLRFNSGFALTMTNCTIRNHTGDGIVFRPVGNSSLLLSNTLIADNGAAGILNTTGILTSGGAGASVSIGQSTVTGNTTTFNVSGDATLVSFGDNSMIFNGDGPPAPPTTSKK